MKTVKTVKSLTATLLLALGLLAAVPAAVSVSPSSVSAPSADVPILFAGGNSSDDVDVG